ncbi:ORF6N domain-containing protein [Arcobacter vandammei]|nr:ORF6N domain-containing protein [Arcobacter vandammei]
MNLSLENINSKIYTIRGFQVMLDEDSKVIWSRNKSF